MLEWELRLLRVWGIAIAVCAPCHGLSPQSRGTAPHVAGIGSAVGGGHAALAALLRLASKALSMCTVVCAEQLLCRGHSPRAFPQAHWPCYGMGVE